MNTTNRGTSAVALILIGLGVLFLIFNLVPGLSLGRTWPVIFFVLAAGFYLPPIVWAESRQGLSALFIPGSVMLTLGLIFLYNTLTGDWGSWAYAWTLIPGGVGLGLALAARFGQWERRVVATGLWIMVGSLVVFGFFGMLFGGALLRWLGPALLIAGGALLLLRSFVRPARSI